MKQILIAALILIAFAPLSSCKSKEEKVQSERVEAAKEIGKAEQKADQVKAEADRKIAEAKPEQKDEEKVKATKDIAKAEEKVGDEKVEATKEITKAEQNAGAGGSYKKD